MRQRKQRINGMMEEKFKIINNLTNVGGVDYGRERVQVSYSNDRLCNAFIESFDLDEQIEQEQMKYFEEEQELVQKIRGLRNNNYIQVLYKVYVQFKPFNIVAKDVDHGRWWVAKYHDEAVAFFEEYYKDFLNDWSINNMKNSEHIKKVMDALFEVEQEKAKILYKEAELKTALLHEMEENQVDKLENVKIRINYINEFKKKMVDVKLLRDKYPDAFRACIKQSVVSPHVKVQVL